MHLEANISHGGQNTQRSKGGRELLAKRLLDLVVAATLVVVLSPLFALLGVRVALENGRPIIYRRRVMGTGAEFDALKFRSIEKGHRRNSGCGPHSKSGIRSKLQTEERSTIDTSWFVLERVQPG